MVGAMYLSSTSQSAIPPAIILALSSYSTSFNSWIGRSACFRVTIRPNADCFGLSVYCVSKAFLRAGMSVGMRDSSMINVLVAAHVCPVFKSLLQMMRLVTCSMCLGRVGRQHNKDTIRPVRAPLE